ncbi:MAG: 4Fe-4S binding protein [Deltaproteobacteria bacterium]|nr:4Fe-4S binding protein [Deltaproteobacteria bacterium]
MTKNSDLYRKLQLHLDKFPIGFPATDSAIEIKLLQHLFNEKEARIATKLNLITEPATKIIKRLKKMDIDLADLESTLDTMEKKGLINCYIKRNGSKFYHVAFLAIGIFEFKVELMTKEFYQLFKQYLEDAFRDEILQTKIPQLRTIPTEGSITPELAIFPYDHVRDLINNFDKEILVANCVCKVAEDSVGKACKVTKDRELCLVFGSAARKYERLGWGRMITKKEVFGILKKAEKDGLVLQPSNTQKLFAMCLCCGCCCEILTSAKPLDNPAQYFSTNYRAAVDQESCNGCKICEKRCQMDAITVENKKAIIDETRCIGCGICVPTCKTKSMRLIQKKDVKTPPKDASRLYLDIMKKKVGKAKYTIMLTKQLLGRLI